MSNYPAWKKREIKNKWRNFLAIFITITLLFAILNGLVKSFSFKNYLSGSRWHDKSSFVAALGTSPPSVFIYQPEPKRMTVLLLPKEAYFATGASNEPLKRMSQVVTDRAGEDFTRMLTLAFGAYIENFAFFKEELIADQEDFQKLFANFASIATPVDLLSGNIDGNIEETNITRIDLIRLWWQLKGLSSQKLEIVDLAPFSEEIVLESKQKVLGVDEQSLHLKISKYLENSQLTEKSFKIEIENSSSLPLAGDLAAQFVTSVGLNVVEVNPPSGVVYDTKIVAQDQKDYVVRYLAKIFKCDIVGASKEANSDEIKIVLGRDFASRYFQ